MEVTLLWATGFQCWKAFTLPTYSVCRGHLSIRGLGGDQITALEAQGWRQSLKDLDSGINSGPHAPCP